MKTISTRLLSACLFAGLFFSSIQVAAAGNPFNYGVGINYDAWAQAWYPTATPAQVTSKVSGQIKSLLTKFRLIHLYRLNGWDKICGNGANAASDPVTQTALSVIQAWNTKAPTKNVEVTLGTSVGQVFAMASGNNGCTGEQYATAFVNALVQNAPFSGNTANVLNTIKTITLGNELDTVADMTPSILTAAITNFYTALNAAGLGEIPLTISLANVSQKNTFGTFPSTVSDALAQAVVSSWQSSWNGNVPFLFANQYPSTVSALSAYIVAANAYNQSYTTDGGVTYPLKNLTLLVGETGFNSTSKTNGGDAGEAAYINAIFPAMTGPTPLAPALLIFEGFDEQLKAAGQNKMGIFSIKTNALKTGISIPVTVRTSE